MTTELLLLGVILLLCGLLGWKEREARLERSKLINALLAKNAQDMVNLDLADKTEIKAQVPQTPYLSPIENVSQEEFEEALKNG
mgnify:CR=1 FL=1